MRWFNVLLHPSAESHLLRSDNAREIEEFLSAILGSSTVGMWEWDIETDTMIWSGSFETIHGLDPETPERTMAAYENAIVPDDRERIRNELSQVVERGGAFHTSYRCRHADGTFMSVNVYGFILVPRRNGPPKLVGVCSAKPNVDGEKAVPLPSATLLESILHTLPDPVHVKDETGRYVFLNRAAQKLFSNGYHKRTGEVIGHTDAHLFRSKHAERNHTEDQEVLRGGKHMVFEHELPIGDRVHHYSVYKAPVFTEQKTPAGIVVASRDVTIERRKRSIEDFLHEATVLLANSMDTQKTLENLSKLAVPTIADWCAIHVVTTERASETINYVEYLDANLAQKESGLQSTRTDCCKIDPASLVGTVIAEGKSRLCDEATDEVLAQMKKDACQAKTLRSLQLRSIMVVPLTVRGRTIGAMTLALCLSDMRYTKSDLRFAEDLARRAAVSIDHARLYQVAKDESVQKDRFLSILSHELRNPIAPIRNYLDLLLSEELDQRTTRTIHEDMLRQTKNMSRLLDDLLDISRVVHNKINLERAVIDARDFVRNAIMQCKPKFTRNEQEFTSDLSTQPLWVHGDSLRLEQIVTNLLSNAARYTHNKGKIKLTLREEEGMAVVRVKDSGVGIPAEMMQSIFDLFGQVPNSSGLGTQGLGIGLTLVRELVALHGGSVEVLSEGEGKGSEFVVRLPLVERPAVEMRLALRSEDLDSLNEQVVDEKRRTTSPVHVYGHVLVVDDNEDGARALAMLLETYGYTVTLAFSGSDALERLPMQDWKAVILDIGLYDIDGYSIAETIKRERLCNGATLIAVTGYGSETDKARSRAAGFDAHFTKPVDHKALQQVLADSERAQLQLLSV